MLISLRLWQWFITQFIILLNIIRLIMNFILQQVEQSKFSWVTKINFIQSWAFDTKTSKCFQFQICYIEASPFVFPNENLHRMIFKRMWKIILSTILFLFLYLLKTKTYPPTSKKRYFKIWIIKFSWLNPIFLFR